jgi:hypothetical protein
MLKLGGKNKEEAIWSHNEAKHEKELSEMQRKAAQQAKKELKAIAKENAHREAVEAKARKNLEKEAAKRDKEMIMMTIKQEKAAARERARRERETARESARKEREARNLAIKEAQSNGDIQTQNVLVPFFCKRSITLMLIGLIIGAGVGFGFWIFSPKLSSSDVQASASTQPAAPSGIEMLGMPSDVPWMSQSRIQVVNPGASYIDLRNLRSTGEYYAAKISSLPFLEYLNQVLKYDAPEYNYTVDELDQMIDISYDYTTEQPTILVSAVTFNAGESAFLSNYVPTVFKEFLITEDINNQEQEYQYLLNRIEQVKLAIIQGENDISVMMDNSINNNPTYVALQARIAALENQLNDQAVVLASAAISGQDQDIDTQYYNITQQITEVVNILSKAEAELRSIELQRALADSSNNNPKIITVTAKITALENELNNLMIGDGNTKGLATMIAEGSENSSQYANSVKDIDRTSTALADARDELLSLQSQSSDVNLKMELEYTIAQAKVDTLNSELSNLRDELTRLTRISIEDTPLNINQISFQQTSTALVEVRNQLAQLMSSRSNSDVITQNLDYQVAQIKLDNLNQELTMLTGQLTSLIGNDIEMSQTPEYLVVGNASVPVPILPEKMRMRNALMIGGLIGVVLAWGFLNRSWLRRKLSSATSSSGDDTV